MNLRMRIFCAALAAISSGRLVRAQDIPLGPTPLRNDLPFAVDPDRLPGPPRVMGELPEGFSQPPSTLPGQTIGNPPGAMGVAPPVSPFMPNFPSATLGGTPGSVSILSPFAAAGATPAASPALPLFLNRLNPTDAPPGELPQALPAVSLDPLRADAARITGPPLLIDEVLFSSEAAYPLFLAVLENRRLADGDVLSALGSFDLNLNADSRNYPLGFYNRTVQDVFVEQPLFDLGGEIFGGYRLATGKWPEYYNYLNTRGSGAFVAGLKLPLLKNREIDARRAKLFQTEIERRKVEPTILKERVKLRKEASKAYWYWVGSGQVYLVALQQARLAELRYQGLEELVRNNILSPIDLESFRLNVVLRQAQYVEARRSLQAAAIELSLYLRDSLGMPMLAEESRLPLEFPAVVPPDPARLEDDVQVALRLRPEIFALRLAARKVDIDREYAVNQTLPSLSLYVYTEQNIGSYRETSLRGDFRPFIMESSLLFDVPIQRRFARGRIRVADAQLRQLALETRYAADRIRADVQETLTLVDAAYQNLVLWREYEQRTRKLEAAEREKLQLAQSNVLNVVIREQTTLDAVIKRIEVEAKYLVAVAEYRAAVGLDAVPGDLQALSTGPNAPAEAPVVPGASSAYMTNVPGSGGTSTGPQIPDETPTTPPVPNTGPAPFAPPLGPGGTPRQTAPAGTPRP